MGLSVSYDRVLGMSADLGNSAIRHFESVGTRHGAKPQRA